MLGKFETIELDFYYQTRGVVMRRKVYIEPDDKAFLLKHGIEIRGEETVNKLDASIAYTVYFGFNDNTNFWQGVVIVAGEGKIFPRIISEGVELLRAEGYA